MIDSEGTSPRFPGASSPTSTEQQVLTAFVYVFDSTRSLPLLGGGVVAAFFFPAAATATTADSVEVVVTLEAPPLAQAIPAQPGAERSSFKAQRLNLRAPTSVAYLRSLAIAQRTLATRITTTVPGARVPWRYQVVLDGLAVVVPRAELGRLASIPGVAEVWPNVRLPTAARPQPAADPRAELWGPARRAPRATGSRSGSSTRASTRRTRSSRHADSRIRPAFRRASAPSRRRR